MLKVTSAVRGIIAANLTICPICRTNISSKESQHYDEDDESHSVPSFYLECESEEKSKNCLLVYLNESINFYCGKLTLFLDLEDDSVILEGLYRTITQFKDQQLADKLNEQLLLYLTFS